MFDGLRDRDKRNVVKSGLRGEGPGWDLLMTARDKQQLAIAKSVDHTSYADEDSTERLRSSHWEGKLTNILYLTSLTLWYLLTEVSLHVTTNESLTSHPIYHYLRNTCCPLHRCPLRSFRQPWCTIYERNHAERFRQQKYPRLCVTGRLLCEWQVGTMDRYEEFLWIQSE